MIKLSSESVKELSNILETIRSENPSNWPYGLSLKHLDHAYIVREPETLKSAGFVGWQNITEPSKKGSLKKTGYYVIGILPEYRGKGFAKSAVSQVIKNHSSEADDVKAFIVDTNHASIALAKSLQVPYILKEASKTSDFLISTAEKIKNDYNTRKQEWKTTILNDKKEYAKRVAEQQANLLQLQNQVPEPVVQEEKPLKPVNLKPPASFYSGFKSLNLSDMKNNYDAYKQSKNGPSHDIKAQDTTAIKSASIGRFLKSIGNSPVIQSQLSDRLAGGAVGGAASFAENEYVLDPLFEDDSVSKAVKHLNLLGGIGSGLMYGVRSPSKMIGAAFPKTFATALGGLSIEQLRNLGGSVRDLNEVIMPTATTLESASSNMEQASALDLQAKIKELESAAKRIDPGKALLATGGMLSGTALLALLYDKLKNKKAKPSSRSSSASTSSKPKKINNKVRIELPGANLSDEFYEVLQEQMSKLNDNNKNIKVANTATPVTQQPSKSLNFLRHVRGMLPSALALSGYPQLAPLFNFSGGLKSLAGNVPAIGSMTNKPEAKALDYLNRYNS